MEIEEKLKAIQDQKGNNLYEHLLNTIGKLVQDHPNNAYEVFEEYSHFVKQNNYKYNDTKNYLSGNKIQEKYSDVQEYLQSMSQYFSFMKVENEEEDQEPIEATPIGYVPDMVKEERLFREVGIGFGEYETFLIFNSLKKFSRAKQATQVRFWGKINGSVQDYYVVEAVVEGAGDEEEIQEPHEPKGTGVNAKQYFVTNDLLDDASWVELPLLMPRHIIQARKIRHLFTGNLNQAIHSSPAFQGTEREYLRAQIARISHSTNITHKHLFEVKTEDDGGDPNLQEIEPIDTEDEEKWRPLKGEQLASLDSWIHMDGSILQEGRLIHQEIEEDDDDKRELMIKERLFMDPFEERLKVISKDQYLDLPTCWVLKTHGNFSRSRHLYKKELVHSTLISLRSLVWPGMYFICKDQFISSIYIGDGHKFTNSQYFPQFPYLILSEPESHAEQDEPNPPGCEDQNDAEDAPDGEGEGKEENEEAED